MLRIFYIAIIFTIYNCVFAQHDHSKVNSENTIVLFSTQNTQYSAEIQSGTDEFFKDSMYTVSLKLLSTFPIDSSNVSVSILKDDSIQNVNHFELLNNKYSAKIKFKQDGIHVLKFTFNLINENKTVNNFSFSFTTNVKNYSHANMEHSDGMMSMMGMGSTGFWLIMGGVMAAMMAVIMVLNTNK